MVALTIVSHVPPPMGGFRGVGIPLGAKLSAQFTKSFAVVVAEEAANPNIRSQEVPSVVRINFRGEPSGRNELAEGGLEGFKFKPFT